MTMKHFFYILVSNQRAENNTVLMKHLDTVPDDSGQRIHHDISSIKAPVEEC